MGEGAKILKYNDYIFIVLFQIFKNFSIYKFKTILWQDFGGAPSGRRQGQLTPPCYATDYQGNNKVGHLTDPEICSLQ